MPPSRLDQQLDRWRQDLVNLTRRNRLPYFGHLRTATLEVLAPRPAELAAGLSDATRRRWSLGLPPGADLAPIGAAPVVRPDLRIVVDKPDEPALLRSLRRWNPDGAGVPRQGPVDSVPDAGDARVGG